MSSELQFLNTPPAKRRRMVRCIPIATIIHPIHDQSFYLTMDHKRRLKEGFGFEPWKFKQNLGEVVFISARCPHQVRNRKAPKELWISCLWRMSRSAFV
ncbi:hypothetical protein GQ457_06G016410 [Hibiscus cannabinus]